MGAIEEVKERLDIVEVISGYVPLKKAGRTYKGLCPFHSEKTPSFVVFPDTQSWHCFGACGAGGDMFAFVMRQENVDFSGALEMLAQRAGVELKPHTEAQRHEEDLQRKLIDLNQIATAYFHDQLLVAPAAQAARQYLERRRLSLETIKRFRLGYAPDQWHALGQYLENKGYREADLLASGLVIAREDGQGHYDRFRNRVMIPISDANGHPIGFGGRVLDQSQPKYLNSPETPVFQKGHVLFGLDQAKAAIRAEDTAIVVEGYMDALQAHQHGSTNVVAAMGTALTEEQVKTLRRYGHTIILALDPDTAGGQATLRGLDLSRRITLHEVVQIGTAVVESQYSSEADVRIAALPPGRDPDDVIRETPEQWAGLIKNALPVIDYYFELMKGQFDLNTARGKVQAADQLLPVLRDIENPILQAHYLQKLARLIQVDEKVLQEQLKSHKRRKVGQPDAWQTAQEVHLRRPFFEAEEHCLTSLLKSPASLAAANQVLAGLELPALEPGDFSLVENQQIFLAIQGLLAGSADVTGDSVRQALDERLRAHFDRLLKHWATLPPVPDDRVESDAVRSALNVRQQVVRRRLGELQALQRDAEAEGNAQSAETYGQLAQARGREKNALQQAVYARTAARQRRLNKRYGVIVTGNTETTG